MRIFVFLCTCVCVHVCMHGCECVHVHVCMCVCMYACIFVFVSSLMHACITPLSLKSEIPKIWEVKGGRGCVMTLLGIPYGGY